MTSKNIDRYKITVCNKQTINGKTDKMQEEAFGTYVEKAGKRFIRYETQTEDSRDVTHIIMDDNSVTVKRMSGTDIIYQRGKKTQIDYRTPYGTIPMKIDTTKLVMAFDERGGTLRICYTISMNGGKYFNDMVIRVRER